MTPEQVQQAGDVWFAGINSMDVEQYLAACAEDAVLYEPVGTPPLENHDARRQFIAGINSLFQHVSLAQDHTYIAGNQAAVKWSAHGTAKNGKAFEFGGIDILTFNDAGQVQTQMAYWDPSALMAQIEG